jgi:type I restriction enzyme, S subunit
MMAERSRSHSLNPKPKNIGVESKILVPALRFSEFEDSWDMRKLGDLGNTNGGLTYSPSDIVETEEEGTLVLRSSNVQNGLMTFDDNVYVNCKISEKDLVQENDILLCVRNGSKRLIGKSLLIEKHHVGYAFGAFMAIYRSESNAFIYHFLKKSSFYKQVHEHLGATINQITGKSLNSFKLYLPTLPEQQKIATFLSAVDEKLRQLTRKKALLEQYKKGVMQKLFPSTGSGQSPEIRFKIENEAGELVQGPDWEEKKLGEIASFLKGKGISKADLSENGKTECIRYGELYTDYGETINDIVSRTDVPKKKLVLSELDDVIIPASGETQIDIATASCVRREKIALGGDLNIIRSSGHGVFLAYYLNSALKLELARLSQGVSVVHLYSSQLNTLKLDLPIIMEQQKIASYLSAIDEKIELVNQQINKSKDFKKGLLQQMFV